MKKIPSATNKRQIHNKFMLFYLLFFICSADIVYGQECKTTLTVTLKNVNGDVYAGQKVKLTQISGGQKFEAVSNASGEVQFTLPCRSKYQMKISNFSKIKEVEAPDQDGTLSMETYVYEPDDVEKAKLFAMSDAEKINVEKAAPHLPDTLFMKSSRMDKPDHPELYSSIELSLANVDGEPLTEETMWLTGMKRKKSIKGKTDMDGKIYLWLLKGDTYTLNFKYNSNYVTIASEYSRGSSVIEQSLEYLGTKEIERRKKIEAERIAAEEKRLKEEEKKLMDYCKKEGISREEGIRRLAKKYIFEMSQNKDTVILAVLDRNRWKDKLIVCDLTGSMSPYSSQLSLWYQLHCRFEKNLQFVFFNDGDGMDDSKKIIGNTGGIYYSNAANLLELDNLITKVTAAGSGGDCPENNMEALIKGTKMAAPFKELVMIVDNSSPVKDLELLKNFKVPVHIILCGVTDWVLTDYLKIAWKTKGSIHTIEQDITKIAAMHEGEEITINGIKYRIMGGEFVRITII